MAGLLAWKTEGRSPIKQIISHQENMKLSIWEITNRMLITLVTLIRHVNYYDSKILSQSQLG